VSILTFAREDFITNDVEAEVLHIVKYLNRCLVNAHFPNYYPRQPQPVAVRPI